MRFLKALLSSQVANVVDFFTTVVLSSVFGVYYVIATALGSVCGGITNCIINYHWVFPENDSKKRYVAIKYFIVWCISLFLNTYGTYMMTEAVRERSIVVRVLGVHNDQIYICCKIIVGVLVALLWNYQMQRIFVYRNVNMKELNSHIKTKLSNSRNNDEL